MDSDSVSRISVDCYNTMVISDLFIRNLIIELNI